MRISCRVSLTVARIGPEDFHVLYKAYGLLLRTTVLDYRASQS